MWDAFSLAALSTWMLVLIGAADGDTLRPSDALLDRLAGAEDAASAAKLENDVYAAWFDAGGPTVDLLMERATEALFMGDEALARDMYDRVILIDPDYAEVWNRRSALFYQQERYDEAIADLQEALQREPRHFGAWIGLGVIFEGLEENAAALAAYREALEIHPFATTAEQGVARLAPRVEGRAL